MFKVFDSALLLSKLVLKAIDIPLQVMDVLVKGLDLCLLALDYSEYSCVFVIEFDVIGSKLVSLLHSICLLQFSLGFCLIKRVDTPEGQFVSIIVREN